MVNLPEAEFALDFYNSGPAIDILESKIATLLGKEKALFTKRRVLMIK